MISINNSGHDNAMITEEIGLQIKDKATVTGITVSQNILDNKEEDTEKVVAALEMALEKAKGRHISLLEGYLSQKSLGIFQLMYSAAIDGFPQTKRKKTDLTIA